LQKHAGANLASKLNETDLVTAFIQFQALVVEDRLRRSPVDRCVVVPEVGLERRQAIDIKQVTDSLNATIAMISCFGRKLVRIEYAA
jgi:hypothetical protein